MIELIEEIDTTEVATQNTIRECEYLILMNCDLLESESELVHARDEDPHNTNMEQVLKTETKTKQEILLDID